MILNLNELDNIKQCNIQNGYLNMTLIDDTKIRLNFNDLEVLKNTFKSERDILIDNFKKMNRPNITMLEIYDIENLADELLSKSK